MKNWIKRWLGIDKMEREIKALGRLYREADKKIVRLRRKPQRYDQVQREQKRVRRSPPTVQYKKGPKAEPRSEAP